MGKFSIMEKRRPERPGAADELKQMRSQEKLLTLRIKKPSEGMFIEGWLEKPDSFFKARGPRISTKTAFASRNSQVLAKLDFDLKL